MKTIKKISGLLLLITLYSSGLQAEISVKGTIRDNQTKLPIDNVHIAIKGTSIFTKSDTKGNFQITVENESSVLRFSKPGLQLKELVVGKHTRLEIYLISQTHLLMEEVSVHSKAAMSVRLANPISGAYQIMRQPSGTDYNTESYSAINENRFHAASQTPLSTFGVDVDAASYSNVRRFINGGNLPPVDAVRIEEMLNYFDYTYAQPGGKDPIAIHSEISTAPWNPKHQLVKIGIQARREDYQDLPASNFVFLIDVSGSMGTANKLPLVKSSIRLLTDQLRAKDKISIVVYAGAAGRVLEPTSGSNKQKIKSALNELQAGGSTAGGQGIKLAYEMAEDSFVKGGNNRIILATDGDFNVGASSDAEMQRLIESKRESGIYLTVLGFGMGNYKDSKMEVLADKGNGNYAYIDNIQEARKTLITEFGGTLFTVAKDVKLQIEFNPAKVAAYRLIGYENRLLNKEDFNNDQKDAGDMGSGHTVTALYEIIPAGVKSSFIETVDDLKYQQMEKIKNVSGGELMTVKLRYKTPDKSDSQLISHVLSSTAEVTWDQASSDLRFSASVAAFGMLLRNSEFKQNSSYAQILEWSEAALSDDKEGYRAEFRGLVRTAELLAKDLLSVKEKMIMESR